MQRFSWKRLEMKFQFYLLLILMILFLQETLGVFIAQMLVETCLDIS